MQAALAVFIQGVHMLLQIGHQGGPVVSARRRAADGVQLQFHAAVDAQLPPQPGRQQDEFRIHIRRGDAECFHADLVELPLAPFLGSLVAEHRTAIPQAPRHAEQALLDGSAHTAGGALRTQGKALGIAVVKGVHLLLDDICHLADGALEQLGFLDHRQAYFTVAITGQHTAHRLLQELPVGSLIRQDVIHPADGC